MLQPFEVEKPDEECECHECGYPLYVGDTGLLIDTDRDRVFCGHRCARKDRERREANASRLG